MIMRTIPRSFGLIATAISVFSGQIASAQQNPTVVGLYSATDVAPPDVDRLSIRLPGQRANTNRETWLNIVNPADRAGFAGPSILRNVSEAALTPFLPDPRKATGAAIVIAPGGGGVELSMELQGYQVARWLNARGITAFVLKYRLTPTPKESSRFLDLIIKEIGTSLEGVVSAKEASEGASAAQQDGLDAIAYVRSHSAQWHLRPNRIGMMGFSAGAFTSINVALNCSARDRPDFVALIYGALSDWNVKVATSAPPAFIAASSDDPQVPSIQSVMIYRAWRQAGVSAELHLFESGGHGFGVIRQGKSSDQWLDLFDRWLQAHDFASKRDATSR